MHHMVCLQGEPDLLQVGWGLDLSGSSNLRRKSILHNWNYQRILRKCFRETLERKASAHPFENIQSLLPPNLWLGVYPIPDHKRDTARAEDALTISYGSELIGMQRDWYEELQSCRKFPHTNVQERIMRDRALYKVTCDFVDVATNGAIGVISRCIPLSILLIRSILA